MTRTGKSKYYFSQSNDGTLADRLPGGFEVHEQASGQVSVRRERPRLITDEELQAVEHALAQAVTARRWYVDRDLEIVTVYVADPGGGLEDALRGLAPFATRVSIDDALTSAVRYEPVFRFVLVDAEKRLFQAQRYCYLGSIDDWVFIGSEGRLADIARCYLVHVGKDSYYDLL
jgi:hypothetical protein